MADEDLKESFQTEWRLFLRSFWDVLLAVLEYEEGDGSLDSLPQVSRRLVARTMQLTKEDHVEPLAVNDDSFLTAIPDGDNMGPSAQDAERLAMRFHVLMQNMAADRVKEWALDKPRRNKVKSEAATNAVALSNVGSIVGSDIKAEDDEAFLSFMGSTSA